MNNIFLSTKVTKFDLSKNTIPLFEKNQSIVYKLEKFNMQDNLKNYFDFKIWGL